MSELTLLEAINTAKQLGIPLKGKGNGNIKLNFDQGPESSNGQEMRKSNLQSLPDHNIWNELGIDEVGQ